MKIKKYKKWLVYIGGFMLLTSFFYVLTDDKRKELKQTILGIDNYRISLKDSVVAGTKLSLQLPNFSCFLFVTSSWGCRLLTPQKEFVQLPDSLLQEAGLQRYTVFCDGKEIASKNVQILPLVSAEPLEVYVGSKSIPADGGVHWAMVTSIPADKFHNLTNDNTPVVFQMHRPNESQQISEVATQNGVAYHKIYSQTKVGKTIIGTLAMAAVGKEKELLEVPNTPISFQITADQKYLFADARQFFKVRTEKIKDAFGNTIADGTLVTFKIVDIGKAIRILTAYTIGGVAELAVQNPSLEGSIELIAMVYGNIKSNKLAFYFKKSVDDFEAVYQAKEQSLKVGPLIGPLNQYVADGAEVEVEIRPKRHLRKGAVKNGYALVDISDLPTGKYELNIRFGGIQKEFKLNLRK